MGLEPTTLYTLDKLLYHVHVQCIYMYIIRDIHVYMQGGVRISQHVSLPAVQLVFGSQPRPATNPRGDVASFLTDFETLYGNTHPDFLQCSYAEVSSRGENTIQYTVHSTHVQYTVHSTHVQYMQYVYPFV